MGILKVALLQLIQNSDSKENLKKGHEYCRLAKKMGADIALFPEMWNNGYSLPETIEEVETWKETAIDQNHEFFTSFKNLAKELNMAIGITYLERGEGLPKNTVSLIDRFGNSALTYEKVHTCDFSSEAFCTPGDNFYTCDLDTSMGSVKIGAMICYDREFPESARILMLKGAEVILIPNACEIDENRKCQLRTRAYENMVGVALTNYAKGTCNGHSMAFDVVSYREIIKGKEWISRNTLIVEAGKEEGIFMACFNIDELREYRESQTWGNAYRKPKVYSLLVSEEVNEPFKRKDARR
jgi:predicted amidohydrolase